MLEHPHPSSQEVLLSYSTKSHKAIHYERQTQVRPRHTFDVNPLYERIPAWCARVLGRPGDWFTLRVNFTLPERRKFKRNAFAFDIFSAKAFEAAQMGLMYARSLFDVFVNELYRWEGAVVTRGLQVGPSWVYKGRVKTCAVFSVPAWTGVDPAHVLVLAARAIFSVEDLNFMEEAKVLLYLNDELTGCMDVGFREEGVDSEALAIYAREEVKRILAEEVKGRNVLYAFAERKGIRQGMMVRRGNVWRPLSVETSSDIERVVREHNVVEFIPAVNRAGEDFPSIVTVETDPGDMLVAVLGKKKMWQFNTYVTEKLMQVLDRYGISYRVKFSGNKGWHIQIPVELREPLKTYQVVVEALVNKEVSNLSEEEKMLALMANFAQLEDVKSYKDPFFVARRFVDVVGAHVMFFDLEDMDVLSVEDMRRLCIRVGNGMNERREVPQVVSINPYSKFRRQFKLLVDHSSNKKEGKMRSVFSLHSGSGLVSVPALLNREGVTTFDERMWDYDFVREYASPGRVGERMGDYEALKLNGTEGFETFLSDHKGLLLYLLQHGGEALELLDTPTALWVNRNLWERMRLQVRKM